MKTRKKEIASVDVSSDCMKTHPCQHFVTVKYTDGTEKQKTKFAPDIADKYGNYLDAKALEHFSLYSRKAAGNNNKGGEVKACPYANRANPRK